MQRTIKTTKFTYVNGRLDEHGNPTAELLSISVNSGDEKVALRMARKIVGEFKPVKVEHENVVYVLPDDEFFKYAKRKDELF